MIEIAAPACFGAIMRWKCQLRRALRAADAPFWQWKQLSGIRNCLLASEITSWPWRQLSGISCCLRPEAAFWQRKQLFGIGLLSGARDSVGSGNNCLALETVAFDPKHHSARRSSYVASEAAVMRPQNCCGNGNSRLALENVVFDPKQRSSSGFWQ